MFFLFYFTARAVETINLNEAYRHGDSVLGENLLTALSSELAAAGKRLPDTQEKEECVSM
jgi:hypothetical protein